MTFASQAAAVFLLTALWPAALIAQKQSGTPGKQVTLGFPNQTLRILPSAVSGTLAYAVRGKVTETKPFALEVVLWQAGISPKITARIPIQSEDPFPFAVSFSPNGRNLLVTTMSPTSWLDEYQLVIVNLDKHTCQQGPHLSGFPKTVWAPDSRHIAYYEGADQDGEWSMGTDPLRLYEYDTATGKRHLIAENDQVKNMAWTARQSLLYAFKPKKPGETVYDYTRKHPAIYETTPSQARTDVLISNGFNPAPSPDGKDVAFLGWQAASQKNAAQYGLYLFHRASKRATLVHPLSAEQHEALFWTPDGKQLLVMTAHYKSTHPPFFSSSDTKDHPGYGTAQISSINPVTRKGCVLTSLAATDEVSPQRPESMFQFKSVSAKALTVSVAEHGTTHNQYRLLSVDLQTGKVTPLFKGTDISSNVSSEVSFCPAQ